MESQSKSYTFQNTEIAFAYKSDSDLRKSRFLFRLINNNALVYLGTRLTPWALKFHLPVKSLIRSTIFNHFCGGESLNESLKTINKLADYHVCTILDYGVEGKQSESVYDQATEEFIKAIAFAAHSKNIPFLSLKITGIARFGLLEKINSGANLTDLETVEWNRVKGRVHRICKSAMNNNKSMMIDAEETWIQNPVDDLVAEVSSAYNKTRAVVYNTIQHYRTDSMDLLRKFHADAKSKNYILGIKLVRGAYMEKERERASALKYPSPIHINKDATDHDYDAAVKYCLDNINEISVCVASHNENSNHLAARFLLDNKHAPNHPHVHFSQLLGMSDHISFNLADAGFNVTKYVPYGPVNDVIPYLMRRAEENTSIGGQMGRELRLVSAEIKRRQKK